MDTPPFTISGLPDETLDSAMARTFKLYAFGSWRHVYEELCGIPGRLPLNGIPGRLDDLATFLGYPLTGMEVLRSLTLWNGFSAFMPAEERVYLSKRLVVHRETRCSPKGQAKPRTRQPFRFCEACVREDYDAYGISYWHRSHQMPLVNLCWKHEMLLQQFVVSRGLQVIPMPRIHMPETMLCGGQCAKDSKRFALFAHEILACVTFPGRPHLKDVYWRCMDLHGLTFGTRIHYEAVASQCAQLQDHLDTSPHLNAPSRWLTNVLYSTTSNLPMHLVLAASLFEEWSDFLDAWWHPTSRTVPRTAARVKSTLAPSKLIDRQALQKIFAKPDASVPQVARTLGVSGNTVRTRARYYGISVPLRKGFISPRVRDAIRGELRRGLPEHQISKHHGISLSTVDGIRRSSREIDVCRRAMLERNEREARRRKLETYLSKAEVSRRSDVRTIDACLYQWLLKHDRAWFEMALPVQVRKHGNQQSQPMSP